MPMHIRKKELIMKPSAEEKIIRGLEDFADALEAGKDVTREFTCRKVVLNLQPTCYTADLVRNVRKQLGLSQALFAQFLGVSTSTVQAWEKGEQTPKEIACRFMDEIREAPDYWRKRFLEMAEHKATPV